MKFIRTERELAAYFEGKATTFWVPIQSDHKLHWTSNRISFIYIYCLKTYQECIVSFHHNDCDALNPSVILKYVGRGNYVYQNKLIGSGNDFEAEMVYWMETGVRLEHELGRINTIKSFQSMYRDKANVNDFIPIMKWLEHCRNIKDRFIYACANVSVTEPLTSYNNLARELANIERAGLKTVDGIEHCEYNPYTSTGRPSNHFSGINYAALNKSNDSRKRFVSRFGQNGCLMEIDLTGFHLQLIYAMMKMPFPVNIYEELGRLYYGKHDLSELELAESKVLTFRQIYGGIEPMYAHLEPFKSMQVLIDWTFERHLRGKLKTFLFGKEIRQEGLVGFSPSKVFNYMLQNLETEFNYHFMRAISELTSTTKTKLTLYTYDSFLFDVCFDEPETVRNIMEIFSDIPHRCKVGSNYHDMTDRLVNEK